jgi:hypothetical protein
MSLDQGSTLGEYRIDSLERTSAGGSLFRAEQPSLGRTVALHVCSEPADSAAGRRFLEVARRVANVDSRELLPVYEVAAAGGVAFAATRDQPGRRLDEILAEGPLDAPRAVAIAEQLVAPLEALARAGVPAAAVPPGSVIVSPDAGGESVYLAPLDLEFEEPAGPADADSALESSGAALAMLVEAMTGDDSVVAPTLRSDAARRSPSLLVGDLRSAAPARPEVGRRSRRRPVVLALAALAVVAAALAIVVPRLGGDGADPNAPAGRIAATIPLGGEPKSITTGEGSIWIARADGTIVQIDPDRNEVVGVPIPFGKPHPDSNLTLRAGEGSLWALDGSAGTLTRIDPQGRRVSGRVQLDANLEGATVADGVVWVTRSSPEGVQPPTYELLRIDASTMRRIGKPTPVESYPLDVDVVDGTAWVTNAGQGTVTRVGPDGATTTIRVGVQPISSVMHEGTLWVPDFWGDTVTPVQATDMRLSGDVVRMPHPSALAATGDAVWAKALAGADPNSPSVLYRIDPASGTISGRPLSLGPDVGWITATDDAVWAPSRSKKALLKIVPTEPAPPPSDSAATPPSRLLSGPIAPGELRDTSFVLPYALDVREPGWIALGPERVMSTIGRVDHPTTLVMLASPTQTFRADGGIAPARDADQILRVLSANPNLVVGDAVRATVGGRPADQVTVRARAVDDYPSFCPEACVPLFGLPATTIVAERSKPVRISLLRGTKPLVAVIEQVRAGRFAETGRLLAGLRFEG